jgi:hypothetical protein
VLKGFVAPADPDLLVGFATNDDAAVYRIGPETAVIGTVDFITPPALRYALVECTAGDLTRRAGKRINAGDGAPGHEPADGRRQGHGQQNTDDKHRSESFHQSLVFGERLPDLKNAVLSNNGLEHARLMLLEFDRLDPGLAALIGLNGWNQLVNAPPGTHVRGDDDPPLQIGQAEKALILALIPRVAQHLFPHILALARGQHARVFTVIAHNPLIGALANAAHEHQVEDHEDQDHGEGENGGVPQGQAKSHGAAMFKKLL